MKVSKHRDIPPVFLLCLLAWWALQGLLSRYPILKLNQTNLNPSRQNTRHTCLSGEYTYQVYNDPASGKKQSYRADTISSTDERTERWTKWIHNPPPPPPETTPSQLSWRGYNYCNSFKHYPWRWQYHGKHAIAPCPIKCTTFARIFTQIHYYYKARKTYIGNKHLL